jgi:hypothetical protein
MRISRATPGAREQHQQRVEAVGRDHPVEHLQREERRHEEQQVDDEGERRDGPHQRTQFGQQGFHGNLRGGAMGGDGRFQFLHAPAQLFDRQQLLPVSARQLLGDIDQAGDRHGQFVLLGVDEIHSSHDQCGHFARV